MQLAHFIILAPHSRFTVVREKKWFRNQILSQPFHGLFRDLVSENKHLFECACMHCVPTHMLLGSLHVWTDLPSFIALLLVTNAVWNFSFIQCSEIMEKIDRDVKCTTLTCISSVQMPIAVSSTKLVRNTTKTWVINPNYFPGSNYCLPNCEHNPCWNLCKFSCIWFIQVCELECWWSGCLNC